MGKNKNELGQKSDEKIGMEVSLVSIGVNLILSLFKLFAGIFAKSSAMISDAVHSASDVFSTFVVMIGVHYSNKESDDHHQYGHERLECIASIILSGMLAVTGAGIGFDALSKILDGTYKHLEMPGVIALAAAVISIGVKEWMYWYTRAAAKKINSGSLMADAWHHRSDSLSSVGSFIGVLGARMGFPIFDPAASVVISIFILKVSVDIFKDSMEKLVDRSCDKETEQKMEDAILKVHGVARVDLLKTRMFGSKIYVDIEIGADGGQSLRDAHEIAENVHHKIEQEFKTVKHCMVHVNPL